MADRFPGKIEIGGEIKPELIDGLLEAIQQDSPCSGPDYFGETPESLEDLHTAVHDDYLTLTDDQAHYGNFPAIEAFCIANKIPFQRHSDAKYEYDAEFIVFQADWDKPRHHHATNNEQLVVPADTTDVVLKKLEKLRNHIGDRLRRNKTVDPKATLRSVQHLVDYLKKHTRLPDLPPVKLPDLPNDGNRQPDAA